MTAAKARCGFIILLALGCSGSAALSACERRTPAEKAGDKIEQAGDKLEDKLDEAN